MRKNAERSGAFFRSKNAGLGIAFNAKEILKRAADGSVSRENLKGMLYALGATDYDLRRVGYH